VARPYENNGSGPNSWTGTGTEGVQCRGPCFKNYDIGPWFVPAINAELLSRGPLTSVLFPAPDWAVLVE